jgi:hypothetical protein
MQGVRYRLVFGLGFSGCDGSTGWGSIRIGTADVIRSGGSRFHPLHVFVTASLISAEKLEELYHPFHWNSMYFLTITIT